MGSINPVAEIMRPGGPLTASAAARFHANVRDVLKCQHVSEIAVDMAAVESVDDAGLRAVLSSFTLAQRSQKRFSLYIVTPAVRIVLELAQLDRAISTSNRVEPVAVEAA